METLYFGDPEAAALAAAVVAGIGALVSAVAFAVVAKTRARRWAAPAAGALAAAGAALAYWLFLTPFYAVELGAGELRLRSYYPSRAVTLAKGDIAGVERLNQVTKNDYRANLIVRTKDGRTFTSGNARPRQLADEFARLEAWLAEP